MAPSDRPAAGTFGLFPPTYPVDGICYTALPLRAGAVFITYPVDGICYPDLTISSSVKTLGLKVMNLEEHLLLPHARRGHGLYLRWGIKTARVRPDQDQRPPARRRQPELHQRARARRRRRTLLRPAASLRTRSRGIAPPSPLLGMLPRRPRNPNWLSIVWRLSARRRRSAPRPLRATHSLHALVAVNVDETARLRHPCVRLEA